MMGAQWWIATALACVSVVPVVGQELSSSERRVLFRVDGRLGFLITQGESFGDRVLSQIDVGVQWGRARVGAGPVIGVGAGVSAEVGDIFANIASSSYRVLGGVEVVWALAENAVGQSTLELVPLIQAGYQTALESDERSGFTGRVTAGLRVLPAGGPVYVTFEPLSLAWMSLPNPPLDVGESRLAYGIGLIKLGVRW